MFVYSMDYIRLLKMCKNKANCIVQSIEQTHIAKWFYVYEGVSLVFIFYKY